jgi:formylmethanofuran dehydrogenase subunit E
MAGGIKTATPEFFEKLLAASVAAHGHLCAGQVVGVRMALLGLRLLNFEAPPTLPQLKRLLVYVEMDRCTGDAVANTTGVKLGRRSLKFVDYGIMAATFVDLGNSQAFRIISTEESRDLAAIYAPLEPDKAKQQVQAYKIMPDSVMFRVQEVKVELTPFDLPGPTRRKVTCSQCGQLVRDHREVEREGRILCKPCAGGAYFTEAREIIFPDMSWSPYTSKRPLNPESLSCPARAEGGAMRKTR